MQNAIAFWVGSKRAIPFRKDPTELLYETLDLFVVEELGHIYYSLMIEYLLLVGLQSQNLIESFTNRYRTTVAGLGTSLVIDKA